MARPRTIPTLAQVNRLLQAHPIPAAIIGTKRKCDDAGWCDGDGRSLLHSHWMLRTADKTKRRHKTDYYVGFDAPVDFGDVRLSSDALLGDALTKKLVLLAMLNGTATIRGEAAGMRRLALSMDWLTRWRLDRGIRCNAELRPEDFKQFRVDMQSPEIVRLVAIDERVKRLVAAIESGTQSFWKSPLRPAAAGDAGREIPDFEAIAAHLGITAEALHSAGDIRERVTAALRGAIDDCGTGAPSRSTDRRQRDAIERSSWSIAHLLAPWEMLRDLSARGVLSHDPLCFDPFAGTTWTVTAAQPDARITRTGGISPPFFFAILSASAKWVLDYSGPLLRALALMRDDPRLHGDYHSGKQREQRMAMSAALDAACPSGMPRLWLAWLPPADKNDVRTAGRISLMVAVSHLMTACLLLVAALAARSIEEVLALKAGCILRPARGLFELTTQVDGGLRDLDRIPVPAIVAYAVELLETLTARTRALTGEDWLFRYRRDYVRRSEALRAVLPYVGFPKPKYIQSFLAINGLPDLDPGTSAWLTGPDMMKGFAVSYHYVMPGASDDALTRFLGGWDPAAMRAYVHGRLPGRISELQDQVRARKKAHSASASEGDAAWLAAARKTLAALRGRAEVFDEVRCEAVVERMLRIVDGSDVPGGRGGARLVSQVSDMVARAQARARLGSSNHPDAEKRALWDILLDVARVETLEHVPGGPAHCRCRPNHEGDLATAVCLQRRAADPLAASPPSLDGMPDHAYSGLVPCLQCDHGATFGDDRAVGQAMCGRVADAAARAPSPDARAASEALLEEMRSFIAKADSGLEGGP